MNVAVVGAGNGGQAAAGHLSLQGHQVRLYDRFREAVEPLAATGEIRLLGAITGVARLAQVTSDLAAAVNGAAVILLTVPGFAFDYLAEQLVPCLRDGQIVILHPGGTGGAFEVRRIWGASGVPESVALGATETLLYACRLHGPGVVDIRAVKRAVGIAALPAQDNERVFGAFRSLYPQAVLAGSVFETSLANTNPVMHPPIVLLNARIIDEGAARFDFYGGGVTPAVARVVDALDSERVAIGRALGIPTKTDHEWVRDAYGLEAEDTAALCRTLSDQIYMGLESPSVLCSRYLTEDVPLGLVPLAELAGVAKIEVPVINAIIDLASVVCGEQFRTAGRTLARMGLDRMSLDDIRAMVGAVPTKRNGARPGHADSQP